MTPNNEFLRYATKHIGMSSQRVEDYAKYSLKNVTPYIIEERQLNATVLDVFSRLMMDRIIFLGTPVFDEIANIIQAQLLFLQSSDPKRDISMYINSPGGSVISGLGIYDTMQFVSPDVSTICTGLAASMGAVLLSAGSKGKRTCLHHSRVMIHQPLGGMQGQVTEMEIYYKLIKEQQKELYDILAQHTEQPYDKIEKDCDRDNWMTAEEAKAYGLVDEVLSNKPAANQEEA